jgi:hypothetical protein
MNRLAVLLAAVGTLGTGCVVSGNADQPGDLTIYWTFARYAPAQPGGWLDYDLSYGNAAPNATCPESLVDTVRIYDPSGSYTDVACAQLSSDGSTWVQGTAYGTVPGGTSTFRLVGYRTVASQEVAVFDSTVDLHVNGSSSYTVSLEGVPAPFDMYAYLAYGSGPTDYATCADALNPNLAYDVRDDFGNPIWADTVGCSGALPALVLSTNDLDLDHYYVRLQGLQLSDGAPVLDSCWLHLDHFGAQTGSQAYLPTLLTAPMPTSCATPW